MSPRRLAVAAVLTLSAISAGAHDGTLPPRAEARLELRELFARAPGVVTHDRNGITVEGGPVEVVVAQIDENGRLIKSCVDTEEAALRFFQRPASQKGAKDR